MNATEIARWAVRVLGLVMIVLGLAIWTGTADALVPIHMLVGLVFVLALLGTAFLAGRAGAPLGLVITAGVVGLLLPALGIGQEGLLVGDAHWVVEVVHLGLGVAAIGLGEALSARAARDRAALA